jgi:Zn-dependent protease
MDELIQKIAVYALPVIFAITLHEAAHAYAAKYFGDTTAYLQGRMSLNPLKHIDPFGTIIIPLVLLFLPGSFLFGYAKPVPVEFGRLRNPKRDMAWVALAGPMANLVMAVMWQILLIVLVALNTDADIAQFFLQVAQAGVFTNLLICAFNLFPIPPLDGGRILFSILPDKQAYQFARLEPYGFFIVLGLAYFQILNFWMAPVMYVTNKLVQLMVLPFKFLLI